MDFAGLAYDPLLDTTLPADFGTVAAPTTANGSRKRSRSTTPTPTPQAPTPQAPTPPPVASLASRLGDPAKRNAALNELLQSSATNYALDGEDVLKELAAIVFDALDWDPTPQEKDREELKFSPWKYPNSETKEWAQHCQESYSNKITVMDAETLRTIEVVLVILRNLSFAAANARLLAFSPNILAILIGALYQGTFSSSPAAAEEGTGLAASGLNALLNLAPHLDVTGQKLFCDQLFFHPSKNSEGPLVPDPDSFGLAVDGKWGFGSLWLAKRLDAKEDVMTDISKSTLLELTNATDYVIQVWAIFPAVEFILMDPKTPRTALMMAVDLLQEFVNHARVGMVGSVDNENSTIPSARAILVNIPEDVLQRLSDLLYIPRLGPDCLSYEDPTINIVTRVNMFKLMTGYDATVDSDVRDRALDVLVPLLELDSPRMALRVALDSNGRIRTRFFDALVPVLGGTVGRNESSMLASQLMKELAKAGNEVRVGLSYIQGRVIEMAARDARVANLAISHLYPAEKEDTDHEDTADEQEENI